MHYSDCGCWAARGRAAQQEAAAGRASLKGDDSGVHARQAEHGGDAVRLGGDGAGRGGAEVRLLRLGRLE